MIAYNEPDLKKAHVLSFKNHAQIMESKECGCFFCLKTYPSEEVELWYDEQNKRFTENGSKTCTAFCPICETDSVLASSSENLLSKNFLKAMQIRWFHDFDYDLES